MTLYIYYFPNSLRTIWGTKSFKTIKLLSIYSYIINHKGGNGTANFSVGLDFAMRAKQNEEKPRKKTIKLLRKYKAF